MKCKFIWILAIGISGIGTAQVKLEREFRIRKDQFPESALAAMEPYLVGARQLRFYREIDSGRTSVEMKFKLRRLRYSIEFTPAGTLEDVEITIGRVDIPGASLGAILDHLNGKFGNYRIRKIQQQYPRTGFESDSEALRAAFQNLILPVIRYELVIRTRGKTGIEQYEVLYGSDGAFLNFRIALPPNYDHVLY